MSVRIYRSNLLPTWPIERQNEVLAPYLEGATIYEDELSEAKRQSRLAIHLIERAVLLRPTSRPPSGEMIVIPSPGMFAFDLHDLAIAMAAATERHAVVMFMDTGLTIQPDYSPKIGSELAEAFRKSKVRDRTSNGRKFGREVAAERVKLDVEARLALIRDDWKLRTIPTKVLLKRAAKADGTAIAPATVRKHLGRRHVVQARYERNLLAAALRAAEKETQDADT